MPPEHVESRSTWRGNRYRSRFLAGVASPSQFHNVLWQGLFSNPGPGKTHTKSSLASYHRVAHSSVVRWALTRRIVVRRRVRHRSPLVRRHYQHQVRTCGPSIC
jgi:hypothetical protein